MKKVCVNCRLNASLFIQSRDINRTISEEIFDYYKCSSCKLIFLSPIPKNLGDFYPQDYYYIHTNIEDLARVAEFERYKINIVNQFMKGGELLEIGPATGGFAYLAKQEGYDVEVIEMNKKCCEFLEGKLGIRAINSNNEKNALAELGQKDVIALWQVIEHLQDPFELLIEACNKLKSSGILVIAAPNPDSMQFAILGRSWVHLDAPRHVFLIPKNLLIENLKARGMELVFSTTNDIGSIGWNKFGWQFSLTNCFYKPIFRDIAYRLGGYLTKILSPIETREGRGSAYTLVFKKK